MTFLTRTEIMRFRRLIEAHKWDEAAVFGEQLLRKDPRDGAGIRFGVMDAYSALGDSDAAEDLCIRYCSYAPDFFEPESFMTAREVKEGWSKEGSAEAFEHWQETLDDVMTLQLAMAYWKDGESEKAEKLVGLLPEYGKEYLEMDEEDIAQVRAELENQPGYRLGTVEAYIECITVPYKEQRGFREWYKGYENKDA